MPGPLKVSIGQYSDAGRKRENQDFHGALVPRPPALDMKGVAVAIADGISSSAVSAIASETAVKSFLTDYYCTSESWTVKTSACRVIEATNSWLHAQNGRSAHDHDRDKGYVCTFTALVLKSRTAHIFHVGDCRLYRLGGMSLEPLTNDHRVSISSHETYLARALGVSGHVEIDYTAAPLQTGDLFVLATDGVYEHVDHQAVILALENRWDDLDRAARDIAAAAIANGSPDNVTLQIVRVDALPAGEPADALDDELPPAPLLEPRQAFEGYEILREIHANNRSHIYKARDTETGGEVALKVPATDLRAEPALLRCFMMEEWIARRISSAHVLRPAPLTRRRGHLYVVTEFIEGQTLSQWMTDNPRPALETVRGLVEQIAAGLRAFHRMEMVHQDLRPQNIMIDTAGTVKIIDFGSARVAGIAEAGPAGAEDVAGSLQYTAPECLLGEPGAPVSDLFSLGVIAYQMLTGRLPYGARAVQQRSRKQQERLRYAPAAAVNPEVPPWVDAALRCAVHPDPARRYRDLSEFTYDLRHPNAALPQPGKGSLADRDPAAFWRLVSAALLVIVLVLLWQLHLA